MLSWARELSTRNVADAFGYDRGRRGFPRRLDELEDCGGGRGRHRCPRALQPAPGEERWKDPRTARRRAARLSVEGARPRVFRGRGGRTLAPGARRLRRGILLRVSQELSGIVQALSGVCPGSPGVWNVREVGTALRAGRRGLAGRGLRTGGDRGPGPPRRQLALGGARRARRRAQPTAHPKASTHLPDRLRYPRPPFGAARRSYLRPLPRPCPWGHALPRHRLPVGPTLLPKGHDVQRPGFRDHRVGR